MSDLSKDHVIDDHNAYRFMQDTVDGQRVHRGLVPRDYGSTPVGSLVGSVPFDTNIPLIPRVEWPDRIAEMEAKKTRLSDIRMKAGPGGAHIPALDQNGQGYCWSYSSTGCVQLARAVANQPHVPLSAHSVACVVKNFRDEGGWCGLSFDYIRKSGIVPQQHWPAQSMNRSHNTPANWEIAKAFRIAEGFVDLAAPAYGKDLSFDQLASCLLAGLPCVGDFNWWGHSVCLMDLVEVDSRKSLNDPNRWGVRDLNSWSDRHGSLGTDVLIGNKAIPDGALCIRAVMGD